MTSRRSFFRTLGLASAALYLRLAPDKITALDAVKPLPWDGHSNLGVWIEYQANLRPTLATPAFTEADFNQLLEQVFRETPKGLWTLPT